MKSSAFAMGRRLRLPAAAVALLVSTTLVSGCGGSRPAAAWPAGTTAIVVGNRANMPVPILAGQAATTVDDAIRSGDQLYLVSVSGDPTTKGPLDTTSRCDSKTTCNAAWGDLRARVDETIRRSPAGTGQADLLEAISRAQAELSGGSGSKHLVVVDSGFQTAGAMPLQGPGAMEADPAEVVKSLRQSGSLPDLRGISVTFTGLGVTAPPQVTPHEADRKRLHTLWETVLQAGHPKELAISESGLSGAGAPAPGLPPVTPVVFEKPTQLKPVPGPSCVGVREDQVGFRPDLATFRSPAQARRVLKPIADAVIAQQVTLSLTGTTAYREVDPTANDRLSLRRARAVEELLLALHVPKQRIVAVDGVGIKFRTYRNPIDAKGRRIETIAVQDRLVQISIAGGRC